MTLPKAPEEQGIYARWLEWGARAGLLVLVLSFVVYALELLTPLIPHAKLPTLWHLPAHHFAAATGAPTGWDWTRHLDKGDYVMLVGVAMLVAISAHCYARIIAVFAHRGERLHVVLAALQIVILIAAASGFLAGGH